MPIEEYEKRIKQATTAYEVSSLAGLAFVDDEISGSNLKMIERMCQDRIEALKKNAAEEETLRKTRERLNG